MRKGKTRTKPKSLDKFANSDLLKGKQEREICDGICSNLDRIERGKNEIVRFK